MAFQKIDEAWTYARNAGADLSDKLHYLTKVDTDGDIVLAGAGELVLGNITEPAVANRPVTVQFGGIGKVKVGSGGVIAGAKLAAASGGVAVTAAGAGTAYVGVALASASEGGIVPFVYARGVLTA